MVQTAQSLQPDFAAQSAALLTQLVLLQQGSPASPLSSSTDFTPDPVSRWVNGFWFTSLAFSLVTAFVAVLIKQWAQNYMSVVSGTPQEQVRVRQFRYLGIQRWQVPAIVGLLPVLMHIALLLFFAGLVVFLSPLSLATALITGVIAFIAYAAYIVANLLPLRFPDCPYKTPLSDYVYTIHRSTLRLYFGALRACRGLWIRRQKHMPPPSSLSTPVYNSLKHMHECAIERCIEEMDAKSLTWLYSTTSNPSVLNIVLQSISGLHLRFSQRELLIAAGMKDAVRQAFQACFIRAKTGESILISGLEANAERLGRSSLQLGDTLDWSERQQFNGLASAGKTLSQPELSAVGVCYVSSDVARKYRFGDHSSYIPRLFHQCCESDDALHPLVWTRLLETGSKYALYGRHPDDWALGIKILQILPIKLPDARDTATSEILSTFSRPERTKARLMVDYLHAAFCQTCTKDQMLEPNPPSDTLSYIRLLHVLLAMFDHYERLKTEDAPKALRAVTTILSLCLFPLSATLSLQHKRSLSTPSGDPSESEELKHCLQVLRDYLQNFLQSDRFFSPKLNDKHRAGVLSVYKALCSSLEVKLSVWWLPEPFITVLPPPVCTLQLMRHLVKLIDIAESDIVSDARVMCKSVWRMLDVWFSDNVANAFRYFRESDGLRRACLPPAAARIESHQPLNTYTCRVVSRFIEGLDKLDQEAEAHLEYLLQEETLMLCAQHFTVHRGSGIGWSDDRWFVSVGSVMQDRETLLKLARMQPGHPAWRTVISTIVSVTRNNEDFHFSRRDFYGGKWHSMHGYYRAFVVIEQLKDILCIRGEVEGDEFKLFEYVSGKDLEESKVP